ncbi:MAG TPA: SDR family NAD(P)-dependent oxidoreductase [Candidatus Thermoplasmatota archaeon]|nr:SDR family NAD(P)-dependent oxidoreductase [Candidatus Thermoplasmatota archaeon]
MGHPDWGLRGAWCLVTGSTRGNGLATANLLASVGANVVITSRNQEEAYRKAEELARRHGVTALGVGADVSVVADVARLFRDTLEASGGRLDVLVNNAGYVLQERLWKTPLHALDPWEVEEAFEKVYRVDLAGARYCTYHALPVMMRQRRGSILYVSSTPALTGYQGTPYTEAKAGVLGLMRDVAREYGPHGIRANAIAPGNIRTAWVDALTPEEQQAAAAEAPLKRWGEPEEVAKAVLFFASELSSFVTGQTLVVDGGTLSH